ncbi:MAG: Gfo/Idh/MocA family oxidoreductase [Sporocytophaga sp.]|uniref:Gfo/Idh/MocA family oxidoreductase n=1 Tax=Sporocytophaga sp. TaxID=2231183 RepID=UPI001B28D3D8|nr:Gfo/Idh/MocA family oxidoreductase [Sporocytophaga sp.]MBO9698636.1 Gfo/Idh/MocA family oxidoreductase [Sporocytophaga sp.]
MNIVLVGAGQIGSRHLQGLALLKEDNIRIQVLDPSEDSLRIARDRFYEIAKDKNNISIEFISNFNEVVNDVNVAIVATSSKVRRTAIEELVQGRSIKYLLLEKFLFSDIRDYEVIQNLINEKQIKAFVNCPRRLYPDYIEIKDLLKDQKNFIFNAVGSNWGLGCNGIHLLDLFCFFTETKELRLNNDWLDEEVIPSKRAGYVEFSGTITGTNNGSKFLITSYPSGNSPLVISMFNENFRILIEEGSGTYFYSSVSNGWAWEQKKFTIKFQSQLTNLVVEELVATGTCGLTAYEESAYLHHSFLKNILSFIERTQGKKTTECLIT